MENDFDFKKDFEEFQVLEEVGDGYAIQQEEEKLRESNKLKIDYHFDTSDFIHLIQGAWSNNVLGAYTVLAQERDITQSYRHKRRRNTVYAFAYEGLYGRIHILEPHRIELMNQLAQKSFVQGPQTREEYIKLVKDVFYLLKLSEREKPIKLNYTNIDSYIDEFIQEGGSFFKANFLLREQTWQRRLKYLLEKKILVLENTSHELKDIEDKKLFIDITKQFSRFRPKPNQSNSNFYDALALYYLQKKLEEHIEDPIQALPVFFASSPTIKKVVDSLQKENPKLFTYTLNNKRMNIVRDVSFFILEPVFTKGDHTEDFFKDLQKAQPEIRTLLQKEYSKKIEQNIVFREDIENAKRQFYDEVEYIIDVKFIQEIWLQKAAYKNLIDDLKMSFKWKNDDLGIIIGKVKDQLEESLKDAQLSLQTSKELAYVIQSFYNIGEDIKILFPSDVVSSGIDVFRDFALMKFGLDKIKLPKLQDLVKEIMFEEDINVSSFWVYHTISLLTAKGNGKHNSDRFLNGLVVCWLLDKHDLIVKLCEGISEDDLENQYEIALIYAASIIALKRNRKGINETQRIINCITRRNNQDYKIWLGIAYLYYRMWEIEIKFYSKLPEMDSIAWNRFISGDKHQQYIIHGAILYARKSYEQLKFLLEHDEENFYLQSYLYSLNNIIYYTTKSGNQADFRKLSPLEDEFKQYELSNSEWQGRFFDTLGWYTLRKYFYTKDEILQDEYIEIAEQYHKDSKNRPASPRDSIMYKQLNDAIVKIKEGL